MHHRKLIFKGRLAGVALAPEAKAPMLPAAAAPEPAPPKEVAPPPPPPPPAPPPPPPVDTSVLRLLMENLKLIADSVRGQHRDMSVEIAQTAVELAVALAERVVQAEIAANRQRLDRIVSDALERMAPTAAILVRGNADDLALLERQLEEDVDLRQHRHLLSFHAEKDACRGELKLEADEWFVEWDTQRSLAELRESLSQEIFADG